ncbi:MAG: beta-phosphoglucomutase [Spirochaetes bacterium]|nr:beta-phosphoglucomutase [Spirochaetota bacterium]
MSASLSGKPGAKSDVGTVSGFLPGALTGCGSTADSIMERDWQILEGSFYGDNRDSAEGAQWRQKYAAPESLFALSNGYFGVRAAPEEDAAAGSGGRRATYVNGYFERSPIVYGENAYGYARFHETIVSVPDGTGVRIFIDDVDITLAARKLRSGRRLDLRRGCLERIVVWELPDGRQLEQRSERFVSLAEPNLAALRITLRRIGGPASPTAAGEPLALRVESYLSLTSAHGEGSEDPRIGAKFSDRPFLVEEEQLDGQQCFALIRTSSSRLALACALFSQATLCQGELPTTSSGLSPATAAGRNPGRQEGLAGTATREAIQGSEAVELGQSFEAKLADGASLVLTKYLAYQRDDAAGAGAAVLASGAAGRVDLAANSTATLREHAFSAIAGAAEQGFSALKERHAAVLAAFWQNSALEVEGPSGLAAAVRFNLFHVYQAAGRDGLTNAAAKGLTGEGYEGHYFWDTEIYFLPLFTYTAPEIARALLSYRMAILEPARARAREMGHDRGVLFPWRTISGNETSAYYPAGTAQYHINADIAYALLRYCEASGDTLFMQTAGCRLLAETARLWMDLGHYGADGLFRIDEVTGPDEYSALVNNNSFTNIMAARNLLAAARQLAYLRETVPAAYEELAAELKLEDGEAAAWQVAAEKIYIAQDAATGVIAQDDSFMQRERWDLAATPAANFPLLLHYHPLCIYRKQVLKQPDLLLAMLLCPSGFSAAEKLRCFEYYEPLTTGDSSLSHCIMSIMAAEVGKPGKAWDYFNRTVRLDLDDLHGNAAHGVHVAAMGGSWLSLVYGFAGFRDEGGVYRFAPALPAGLTRLAFRLNLQGGFLDVRIDQAAVSYVWNGSSDFLFSHFSEAQCLPPGSSLKFALRPVLCGVIFDLDGVIADTAILHYRAWKQLADELGLPFSQQDNEALKGRSRMESLDLLLGTAASGYSPAQKMQMAEEKNKRYRELLAGLTPSDILPGVTELLLQLRLAGIRVGLASASRNAPEVLGYLGLDQSFDVVADAGKARPKPDPEIFMLAAGGLGLRPCDCIGIEDAQAGVQAIRAAGMTAVAVGNGLEGAQLKLTDLRGVTLEHLQALFR